MSRIYFAFALLAVLAIPCFGRTITVDDDGPADFTTIQAAINDADIGDVVEVQPGTYTGEGNSDIDFSGKAIIVRCVNPDDPDIVNATIINCQANSSNQHRGFYFHNGEGEDSVISGLTITHGYTISGGAILCENSSGPTIDKCNITQNIAAAYGGGGGLYIKGGNSTIIGCKFYGNSSPSWGRGGAIYNSNGSNAIFIDCEFIQNYIQREGGAVFNTGSSPTFINCRFVNNTNSANLGGGLYNESGNPVLVDCLFKGNTVREHGGGMYTHGGQPQLLRCKFENNYCRWDGGAIAIEGGSPEFSDCFFSGNSADNDGGAIFSKSGGNPQMTNCTVAANTAEAYGGGFYYRYSSWTMNNCIFWGNSVGGVTNEQTQIIKDGGTGIQVVNYSCIQGWTGALGGTGNIGQDPCFVDPNFHLTDQSPCVDSGSPSFSYDPCKVDIDGQPRVINGRIDMGYDEYDYGYAFLGISSWEFVFRAKQDMQDPPSQTLHIRNAGTGTLSWQIEEDCDWLEVVPSDGVSTGEVNDVNLQANISSLSAGIYMCQLTIESNEANNSPLNVVVNLEVKGPHIHLSANQFEYVVQGNDLIGEEQTLRIFNTGGAFLNYAIDYTCDWLNIEPNQGRIISGDYNDIYINVDSSSLSHGTHYCKVSVVDSNAENNPQFFDVYLYIDTIQHQIDAAEEGDTIIVSPGIYKGRYNRDLDFKGKAIILQSEDPNDPNVVAATIIDCNGSASEPHRAFYFHSGEDANSIISGLTIINGYRTQDNGGAVSVENSSPTIEKCIIRDNTALRGGGIWGGYGSGIGVHNCAITNNFSNHQQYGSGGGLCFDGSESPIVSNCLITGNRALGWSGGLYCDYATNVLITNCTFNGNKGVTGGAMAFWGSTATVDNCIVWNNIDTYGTEMYIEQESGISVNYSDIYNVLMSIYIEPGSTLNGSEGIIDIEPFFAEPGYWDENSTPYEQDDDFWVNGDYHLQSEAGRWDPESKEWVADDMTSPCIDAGDPNSDWTEELWPHGKRINIGAYGGTAEASMSLSNEGNIADLDNNDLIDVDDLYCFVEQWLVEAAPLKEDLDRNGFVDFADFAVLGDNWDL